MISWVLGQVSNQQSQPATLITDKLTDREAAYLTEMERACGEYQATELQAKTAKKISNNWLALTGITIAVALTASLIAATQ